MADLCQFAGQSHQIALLEAQFLGETKQHISQGMSIHADRVLKHYWLQYPLNRVRLSQNEDKNGTNNLIILPPYIISLSTVAKTSNPWPLLITLMSDPSSHMTPLPHTRMDTGNNYVFLNTQMHNLLKNA